MRRLLAGLTAIAVALTVLMTFSPAEAANRYAVTVFASTAKVDVGQSVTLRGKVTPKAAGQKVKVQRLVGSTWTTLTRATLTRRSKYAATIKVTAPGDNRYRVVKPRSAGHKKGVSPTVTVVGWRWRSVSSLPLSTYPGHSTYGTTHTASGILNGNVYAPFIKTSSSGAGGNGYYRLDGKCTKLDVHIGGSHDSATTTAGTAFIFASLMSDPGTIGPVFFSSQVSRTIDPFHVVRGPATMSTVAVLEFRSSGGDPGDLVGWGDARVYCRS